MITMPGAVEDRPYAPLYAADVAKRRMVGIQEARDKFRECVDLAERDSVQTVVARRGKAVVAVVPMEWFRRASELMGEPTEF